MSNGTEKNDITKTHKRIPKLFPIRIPQRRLERKILRRIPIRTEREWVRSLYGMAPGGRVTPEEQSAELSEAGSEGGAPAVADKPSRTPERAEPAVCERSTELSPEDIRHLRRLAKAVRHNRGFFQPVKLWILGVIVVAVTVFAVVFANPLAASGVERGLELVFGARADIDGFRLRIAEPGFAFESLSVANRNEPMENLFELARGELRLDLGQLLRGRIVVRSIEARDLAFATERNVSGELPPHRQPPEADPGEARPSAEEQISSLLGDVEGEVRGVISGIDARAILEAELEALRTPDAVEAEIRRAETIIEEWNDRADRATRIVEQLESDAREILALDPATIDSVSRLREAYATAERVIDGGRSLYVESERGVEAAISAGERLGGAFEQIARSLDEDIAYIEGRIPDPETVLRAPFAGIITGIVERQAAPYIERVQVALDAYERLTALRERFDEVRGERGEPARRGRDLTFPTTEYPRFLLEKALVSVVDGPTHYEAELRTVSSDPDLTGEPVRAGFLWETDDRGGSVGARIDYRETSDERFGLETALYGQAMDLATGGDGVIPVRGISGTYDLDLSLAVSTAGSVAVAAGHSLVSPVIEFAAENELTRRARSVLDRTGTVVTRIVIPAVDGPPISTNLDEALAAEIAEFVNALREQALDEAETLVRARFAEEIVRVEEYYAAAESVVESARRRYEEAKELYERSEREMERIESRITNLEAEIERHVREEAEAAAREAEERARREAEEAARRAEERAREEAEGRIRDAVEGLPGW